MGHAASAARRSQLAQGGRDAVRLLRLMLLLMMMMVMRVLLLLFELRRRRRRCQKVAIFDRRRSASPSSASAHSASAATAAAILLSHYVAAPFRPGVLEPNLNSAHSTTIKICCRPINFVPSITKFSVRLLSCPPLSSAEDLLGYYQTDFRLGHF